MHLESVHVEGDAFFELGVHLVCRYAAELFLGGGLFCVQLIQLLRVALPQRGLFGLGFGLGGSAQLFDALVGVGTLRGLRSALR